MPSHTIEDMKALLGNTVTYEDEESAWDACNVPQGSEGSLQYEISEVGEGLVWLTVSIWGDLRDYENVSEIEEWFNKVTTTSPPGVMVRSAILEAHTEGRERKVLQYKDAEDENAVQ